MMIRSALGSASSLKTGETFHSRHAKLRPWILGLAALLSFHWSVEARTAEIDLRRDLIGPFENQINGKNHEKYSREVREVPIFPAHARLVFDFNEDNPTLRFEYDREALLRPATLLPDALLFSALLNYGPQPIAGLIPKRNDLLTQGLTSATGTRTTAFALAEIWRDAQAGDVAANIRLLRWKLAAIDGLEVSDAFEAQYPGTRHALELRAQAMSKKINQLRSSIPDYRAPQIDKERMKQLVARNDRAGVAALIRSELPWGSLPSAQKKFWLQWLQAIEHPSKETIWLFRGFQDERAFSASAVEGAGQTGFVAQHLFPSLQQADVDRRLLKDANAEVVPKLTDAMQAHSEAQSGGSIFMSLSLDFDVSAGFVSGNALFEGPPGAMIAVRIDKRRVLGNFFSSFYREREYLAPVVIFPDEVMRLQKDLVVDRDRGGFLAAIEAQGYKPLTKEEMSAKFYGDGVASMAHILRSSCSDLLQVPGQKLAH